MRISRIDSRKGLPFDSYRVDEQFARSETILQQIDTDKSYSGIIDLKWSRYDRGR